MKDFIKEFKEFAIKGNMIDLAVGMIIGSAFTSLVKGIVDYLVMPLLSIFTGKLDFSNMFVPLAGQTTKVFSEAVEQGAVFAYGKFITEKRKILLKSLQRPRSVHTASQRSASRQQDVLTVHQSLRASRSIRLSSMPDI